MKDSIQENERDIPNPLEEQQHRQDRRELN